MRVYFVFCMLLALGSCDGGNSGSADSLPSDPDHVLIVKYKGSPLREGFEFKEDTLEYTQSTPLTVVLRNGSAEPIELHANDMKGLIKGQNADEFVVTSSLAGKPVIAPGGELKVAVVLWPISEGNKKATLRLTAEGGNLISSVDLSGTARLLARANDGRIPELEKSSTSLVLWAGKVWDRLVRKHQLVLTEYRVSEFKTILAESTPLQDQIKAEFLFQVDRLLTLSSECGQDGVLTWPLTFNYEPYQLTAPWLSALTQGAVLNILMRAYLVSNEQRYLDLAGRVALAFDHDVGDCGVRRLDGYGNVYYEEYAGGPRSFILNGFVVGLFGLFDHWVVSGSEHSLKRFQLGVNALRYRLSDFDTGRNCLYQLIMPIQTLQFRSCGFKSGSFAVDKVWLSMMAEPDYQSLLDIGTSDEGNEWWRPKIWPSSPWSHSQQLEGRSVRYLSMDGGSPGRFDVRPPLDVQTPGDMWFGLHYHENFTGEVCVDYDNGEEMVEIGRISGKRSGAWHNAHFKVLGKLRGGGVNKGYMRFHIDLLNELTRITDIGVFSQYAAKFETYLPGMKR